MGHLSLKCDPTVCLQHSVPQHPSFSFPNSLYPGVVWLMDVLAAWWGAGMWWFSLMGPSPVPELAGGGWWQLRTPWRPPCETQCQLQSHLCHFTRCRHCLPCLNQLHRFARAKGNHWTGWFKVWHGVGRGWEPQSPVESWYPQLSICAEIPAPDMMHLDMSGV